MNNNRFCSQKGHEQVQTTHLCTFEGCKLLQRKCCILCINEGVHIHGKADQEHIKLEQVIQKVQQKLHQMENDKDIKPIDLSKRQYKVKEIDSDDNYQTTHISNNEKYLAFGGYHGILKIYDLKKDRIIKKLELNGSINACQFSFDSSQLYVALRSDNKINIIIGFDVEKNFKQIFGQCVISRGWQIKAIITIQKHYLIIQEFGKIIKIDIKRNKQIFKLIDDITTIDYNQQYDVIITGSFKSSIKLWDYGKRRTIINQEKAHQYTIQQIQLINNIQKVLSLDYGSNLCKWSVDLINKKLIKLQEYQDSNLIYSFCSINQNQNLLLIRGFCVKIVDDKGQTIKQIDYICEDSFKPQINSYRQLDNAKYIYLVTINYVEEKYKIILLSSLEQYQ